MLLNISTDRIIFIHADKKIILPYGDLEREIPGFLYNPEFKNYSGKLIVVNWPGSFTNLRIVTLALNTYNSLHDFKLDFVDVSKIDWYRSAFASQKCKRYCIMYIGQKKNYWLVDLQLITNYELQIASKDKAWIHKLHVDNLKTYVDDLWDNWFVDEMVAEGKETMDTIFGEGGYDMYSFQNNYELEITKKDSTKLLEPNYMIEANVS